MMRANPLFATALGCLFALAVHAQSLPPLADFATLEYPARGNVQLDEGTVDLWMISDFDTDYKPDKSGADRNWQATLFNIVFPEENWHYPLYYIAWANGFSMVGYNKPGHRYVSFGPPHWKPGETRHVVFTWSGRKRSLFVDGNSNWVAPKGAYASRDVVVEGEIIGDLTSAIIRIGGGHSSFTLDEIQIRRIALTADEIVKSKDAPLVADVNTLLLDHCDGGPPEIIGSQTGETAGKLTGKYEIVNGKFGKAIKLWVAKQ